MMTELDYIVRHFEERFRPFMDLRTAWYPGRYLEEILQRFGNMFRFQCVLPEGCTEVPPDIDAVILADYREGREPDYEKIQRSCSERGVPLLDLFGLDQIRLHRELDAQEYLTIKQWKELLSGYDVVTVLVPWVADDYVEAESCWVVRRRFLILYDWLLANGKEVFLFWEREEQCAPLLREVPGIAERLIERTGPDRGYLGIVQRYSGKKILHVGVGMVKDGIAPREYGMDSRLNRYYNFPGSAPAREKDAKSAAGADNVNGTNGADNARRIDRASLLEEIDRHDVISLDIFDTLLKRIVLEPKDVFRMAEERTGIRGFADCRFEIQEQHPEFSLSEIYARLKELQGYDGGTAELLRETELMLETALILPRKSMADILDYAKDKGKTILLVSDMYLEEDFVRSLLWRNGITGYSALYLSYRYRKLKHEGLFLEVLRDLEDRMPAPSVLHIGDNYYSDFMAAEESGLDAFYVPSCRMLAEENGYGEMVRMCKSLADRKLLGLGTAFSFDDPFRSDDDRQIAGMIVAPLAMGYLQWVCNELRGKDYKALLFSSRDGFLLLDAYRRMRELEEPESGAVTEGQGHAGQESGTCGLPEGRYFYISRRAASLSGEEGFREDYLSYLRKEGLLGQRAALMDFISEGSSQRSLAKGVQGAGSGAFKADGYYVGIPEYISRYTENIRYFLSKDLFDGETEMKLEVYFTSPEPALDHIGAGGEPVFAKEVRDEKTLGRILSIQDMVRAVLSLYLDRLYVPGEASDRELIYTLCTSVNRLNADNFYYDDLSGQEMKIRP